MPSPILTPTPPSAQIIQQATEALDTWNQLGPIMGLLLVVGLAVIAILVIAYFNRNSASTAINVLAQNVATKDREIGELEKQREADREANRESLSAIHDQMIRSNDILEATKKLNDTRDARQADMLANQARIATAFETLLSQGSVPLQKVAADVALIMTTVIGIDSRTANVEEAVKILPQLKADFNKRLDELMAEITKRATQPVSAVIIPPAGESGQP